MTEIAPQPTRTPDWVLALRSAAVGVARGWVQVWGLVRGWFTTAVRPRVAPLATVVSPAGWSVLLAGAVLLVVGLVFAWSELTFLALTLIAALAIAAVFLIGRAKYAVGVALSPERVVVGERALGELSVQNVGTGRAVATRMELPVGRGVAEFHVPGLAAQATETYTFAVPTSRRAVIVAGPAISVRGDQLGLLRRTIRWTEPTELFVHPRTVRLRPSATGLVRDLEGESTRTVTDSDISFHALRPYEPGDPLRHIHWRTTARTGRLMVRQFEETRRSQLLLVLSEDARHYADENEFELAVSLLASVGLQVIREGTALDVITERMRARTRTPQVLLDDCCRFEVAPERSADLRDFVREATKRFAPPSVVVIITGSRTAVRELRRLSTLFGQETREFVVRAELDAAPTAREIGTQTVATVGRLEQLVPVLSRVMA